MFLFSCAYGHSYLKDNNDGLFNPKYIELTDEFPVYCKEETNPLANKMKSFLVLRNSANPRGKIHSDRKDKIISISSKDESDIIITPSYITFPEEGFVSKRCLKTSSKH